MVFPETVVFDFVLMRLAEEVAGAPPKNADPMPCDRWVARSCLQKAIRRGETQIALRSLATLLKEDRRSVWRHLIVIALEDVSLADIGTVQEVVAAGRNQSWRQERGGDWAIASFLVRKMCEGSHCQAVCDLLLCVLNRPSLEEARAKELAADVHTLIRRIEDQSEPLEARAVAALALGGELPSGRLRDTELLFSVLPRDGDSDAIIATCRAAWTSSRNPMALLLPLVRQSPSFHKNWVVEDPIPAMQMVKGIPCFALDQFTRIGNAASRAYLAEDDELICLFQSAGVPRAAFGRTLGDVLFLLEGGRAVRRHTWAPIEELRRPARWLPAVAKLGHNLRAILAHCEAKAPNITSARARAYLSTART